MSLTTIIFLKVLCVMIIIIHGEDSFDCTGHDDDSYHPIYDAEDCQRYWHCIYVDTVYMHAVKRVCPAGTEFDSILKTCETSSLVDCVPLKSPPELRKTTTTKAWKRIYSRLFSQKYWRTTIPYVMTTKQRRVFDLGDSVEEETTTPIMIQADTTEPIQVLPLTQSPAAATNILFLEKFSKDLNALLLRRRPYKSRVSAAKLFQPGEPENEEIAYTSTIRQRSRRTRSTTQTTSIQTTTQLPLTTFFITTETTTLPITTTTNTLPTTITTKIAVTTVMNTSHVSTTLETTRTAQSDTTININLQPRSSGNRNRRNNMTLYILTSDEHKIRRFSINHTRGFLLNCNQLRRRLLSRRRLRDVFQTTSTYSSMMRYYLSNSSRQAFHHNILPLTMLSLLFFTKIFIIT